MSDYDEEIGGVPVADGTGKDQMRIFPDSVRSIQHLDGSRTQIDLKRAFHHVDRRKAMKEHSRQTALGILLKTVGTTQLTNEARTLRVDKIKIRQGLVQGAPASPMVFTLLVDTVLAALNKKWL